jgi:hypothetical protein
MGLQSSLLPPAITMICTKQVRSQPDLRNIRCMRKISWMGALKNAEKQPSKEEPLADCACPLLAVC